MLANIYNDPATSTRNASLLAKRAGTTVAEAKAFLNSQASAAVNKKWVRPQLNEFAPTGAPPYHWQADVIYLDILKGKNNMKKAIVTVLQTTTRFAYARALTNNKAATVAEALKDILDEMGRSRQANQKKITTLRIDGGSEFKADTAELLRSRDITIDQSEAFTHMRLARTDRFHRSLRESLGNLFERENSDRWVDSLQAIIKNLNDTPHDTLGHILNREATPRSISSVDEKAIRAFEMKQADRARAETDKHNIIVNVTRCRLLVSKTKAGIQERFAKVHRNTWTRETYLITGRNGVNSWLVDVPAGEVKIWPTHSLQLLSAKESDELTSKELDEQIATQLTGLKKAKKSNPNKVNVPAARAARMEERNISLEEQQAALSAPARSKRVSTRVDYKKLSTIGQSNNM
jgi:hypothetical protein